MNGSSVQPQKPGLVEPDADVLVDLPRDAVALEPLGVRRPAVAELGVGDDRAAALTVVADPAGPHVVAVRVGRSHQRAVVVVADRERVGQRVLVRQVLASVVGHRLDALVGHPLVVAPAVPGRMPVVPAVRRVGQEHLADVRHLGPERQEYVVAVRLVPDRVAGGQRHRTGVAEAAYPAQRAEVVVERPVLLHQEDDVLDVLDRPVLVVGRDCGGLGQVERHCPGNGRYAGQPEKGATVGGGHGRPSEKWAAGDSDSRTLGVPCGIQVTNRRQFAVRSPTVRLPAASTACWMHSDGWSGRTMPAATIDGREAASSLRPRC